jgi:hypothetical protein
MRAAQRPEEKPGIQTKPGDSGFADPEATVQPDTGRHNPFAERFLAARSPLDGHTAELLTGLNRCSLGRLSRTGAVTSRAHLSGRRRGFS